MKTIQTNNYTTKALYALVDKPKFKVDNDILTWLDERPLPDSEEIRNKELEIELNENKEQIKKELKEIISNKIVSGFTFGSVTIKTDLISQQNGNSNYSLAVRAMSNAKTYKTNTKYNPMNIILESGVYYITFNGGTTGSTKPTLPTEFQVEVQDNEVTWYKFGLLVSTENGNKYFTPQEIESMFIQFNLITTDLRKAYDEYKSKIEAVTANDELDILKTEIEAL
jgi:activator of 2-hydroxyglutaryl-CoA dehydratase